MSKKVSKKASKKVSGSRKKAPPSTSQYLEELNDWMDAELEQEQEALNDWMDAELEQKQEEETFISKYKKVQEIGNSVVIPWEVSSLFPSGIKMEMHGSDISFGEDFSNLEGARQAVEWFTTQLGGIVVWKGDDYE
jgi:hypothetical protein